MRLPSISAVVMNVRSAHTTEEELHMPATTTVGVRYMIDDVADAVVFYTSHLGFTPQSVHALGGARVQGRQEDAAERLLADARALEEAGAFSMVLELIPAPLAERVSAALTIPTIGIGAGPGCDGQVLVLHDMLGLNQGFNPKFLKRYADLGKQVTAAAQQFANEVREGKYPDSEHSH